MCKRLLHHFCFALCLFSCNAFAQLANWSPVIGGTNFPTNVSGQINGIARISQLKFHATNNSKFYCVTAEGGLFLTNNQASSWTVAPGTETLTSACAAICVDYTNDQNFFLGTGDANYYSNGIGILKSTNGGLSFSPTSLTNCLVIDIFQNPLNAAEFVAATNKGIYKSTNSGVSWAAVTLVTLPFCDLKANAAPNSQILYATTHENIPKLFRSTDYGSTWTQITSGIVVSSTVITAGARIAVTPADPNVVYFEVIGDGGIVHKSNDAGLNFNLKKAGGSPFLTYYSNTVTSSGQGNYNNSITVDLVDPAKVWLQAHDTWLSLDSGATWTMQTFWASLVHTDMHQIMKAPFDNSKLYSCNDGGVWLSTDGGYNWITKSDGLYAYEIGNETGVSSLTNGNFVSIGTQDNGRLYANANGWYTNGGGDDYAKRQFDYNGNIYFDGVNRQINHTGATGAYGLPTTNWNAFGFNHTDPNLAFMGFTDVYRTTNLAASTTTWAGLTTFNQPVKAVHSCIANANRLYVLTSNGNVYVSNNALASSPSFSLSVLPSNASSLGSIASMANNADIVYVQANNAIYRSSNAGGSWTNVTYNLPNVNHRRILSEEYGGTQELVFVATNNAVYYKKAGQTTWTNYSTNLPSRRSPTGFSMYDNGTSQAKIRYASFGRAIWESGFANVREFKAEIIFSGDTTITCASPSIQVTDGSVGAVNTPITYTWNFPGGSPTTAFTASANVSYSVTGTYTLSLTIRDASNNVSTKTIQKYIQVINCNTDTVPGNAIFINNNGNYATTPPLALGNTNSITISAWIKIDVNQSSYAGIIFSANGNATGLNFRNGNQIGYHYNDLASSYNWGGGPVIPFNVWVHVAMVTSANAVRIYVNGVPYTNNVTNAPINFTSGFNLGNDRNNGGRTMVGQMDEVCFYNRSLTQNEIRELMHLTRNHNTIDPSLVTYYQFNEVGANTYDRAGSANAVLNGSCTHQLSTAPVGSGSSSRQTITSAGFYNFSNEGLNFTVPFASIPNGEICVTRLNLQPDSVPLNRTFANSAKKYWIINNYGTNSTFSAIPNIALTGYGTITATQASSPRKYKLFRRATGDYRANSWAKIDSAYSVSTNTNAIVSYSGSAITFFNTQFTITHDSCFAATAPTFISSSNTVCANGSLTLTVSGALNDSQQWKWYTGSCGNNSLAATSTIIISPTIATTYYVRGEGGCATNGSCTAITVSVIPTPNNPLSINGPSTGCEGASILFSVSPVANATFYNWTLPSGWSGNSSTNTILATSNGTTGTINVSAANSCGTSSTSGIPVAVSPTITVTQTLNLCYGQSASVGSSTYTTSGTYTDVLSRNNGCDSLLVSQINVEALIDVSTTLDGATIISNADGAIYQWINCDDNTLIQGENGKTYAPAVNGNYAVIVTLNNCSDTSACMNITTVGIDELSLSGQVKIYPNPVTQKLTIETTFHSGTIVLYSLLGQEILRKEITGTIQSIEMENLSKGVYIIKIESGGKQMRQEVIKQ